MPATSCGKTIPRAARPRSWRFWTQPPGADDVDPEIEWVMPARQRSDSGRGPDAAIRFFEEIDETMEELRLEPQEFIDAGDRVATRLRHHGRGKGSGVELDEELYHQVATFRDGKIVRMEYFAEWAEALE